MHPRSEVEDIILNFDPSAPQPRFHKMGLEAATLEASALLPSAIPWPADAKPTPAPLSPAPSATADLSQFHGYDAVAVTWTAAEAAAMATLFAPGYPIASWYEYRHNVASYVPLVTGADAPFNDKSTEMARYYHSLGLYFPCRIGSARVLLMKSGLHLDYDGPAIPLKKLVGELASVIDPAIFITTGTGGGIGKTVKLGDVVIAGLTRFDCQTQFKNESWASASYNTSALPAGAVASITPALTKPNASRIAGARPNPTMWSAATDAVVTTDFFAFDDSTNHYKLENLGRACDMGDAMVGQALQQFPDIQWHSIRNASDPQIPNPSGNMEQANHEAGEIYSKYGALTTAASLIATWAVIHSSTTNKAGARSVKQTHEKRR
jgi:nucleoside phosphorylase